MLKESKFQEARDRHMEDLEKAAGVGDFVKLLKTYGDHCPVMTKQGVTASGLSTVEISYGRDDIEVRESPSK